VLNPRFVDIYIYIYIFKGIINLTKILVHQSSPHPPPSLPTSPNTSHLQPKYTYANSSQVNTQSKSIIDVSEKYVLPVYARPPFVLSHGEGSYVWDLEGNKYLDFTAGIAVNALGQADAGVAKVCVRIIDLLSLFCSLVLIRISSCIFFSPFKCDGLVKILMVG
jgi:hypothetical protein